MEIKRVPPKTMDLMTHVSDGTARPVQRRRPRPEPEPAPKRERVRRERRVVADDDEYDDDLLFGAVPRSTVGIIVLVIMFIIAFIFGIKELGMSIPVYIIVLVFCTVMGILLTGAPVFVPVLVSALLLVAGAFTQLFPGVALGVAMLLAARLVLKGD